MRCIGCCLSHVRHVCLSIIIGNVLVPVDRHSTCSQPALKHFVLIFDDVISIYHHEIWHVYKAIC